MKRLILFKNPNAVTFQDPKNFNHHGNRMNLNLITNSKTRESISSVLLSSGYLIFIVIVGEYQTFKQPFNWDLMNSNFYMGKLVMSTLYIGDERTA